MTEGEAIESGLPVPTGVPPQLTVYHSTAVPEPPVTDKLIFPASLAQKLFRLTKAEVGATGKGRTVTVTLSHVETHAAFSQRA